MIKINLSGTETRIFQDNPVNTMGPDTLATSPNKVLIKMDKS